MQEVCDLRNKAFREASKGASCSPCYPAGQTLPPAGWEAGQQRGARMWWHYLCSWSCSLVTLHSANLPCPPCHPASPPREEQQNSSFSKRISPPSSLSSGSLADTVPQMSQTFSKMLQKPFLTLIFKPEILLTDITEVKTNSCNEML